MSSKIKNIIIFSIIGLALILAYVFLIQKDGGEEPLLTSNPSNISENNVIDNTTDDTSQNFLSLLLSVKSIKLDDAILSDPAFLKLKDSGFEIIYISDANEGRPNPFAPIGTEVMPSSVPAVNVSQENIIPLPENSPDSESSTGDNVLN